MASVPQGYRNGELHDPTPRAFLFARMRNILVFADCSRPRRNISPVVRSGYRETGPARAKMAPPTACLRIDLGRWKGVRAPEVERARKGRPRAGNRA